LRVRPAGQVTGDVISSPHDPQARYGNKGNHAWIGYKLYVTETVAADLDARFITDVTITPAFIQDNTAHSGHSTASHGASSAARPAVCRPRLHEWC